MTTFNISSIISQVKSALSADIERTVALAKESSAATIFNIANVPELGNVAKQANAQAKYLETLKDAQSLYDIVQDVFVQNDVENYEETEAYEQVCDIRSDAESELAEKIDEEIRAFLSKTLWQEEVPRGLG